MIIRYRKFIVPSRLRRLQLSLAISLTVLLAPQALAQSRDESLFVDVPKWCSCALLESVENQEERARLLDQIRLEQSACWQEMGVSPTQARKGQGAGLDACSCECLNEGAETASGPWGDRKKSGQQGQGNPTPAGEDRPDSSTTATDTAERG